MSGATYDNRLLTHNIIYLKITYLEVKKKSDVTPKTAELKYTYDHKLSLYINLINNRITGALMKF